MAETTQRSPRRDERSESLAGGVAIIIVTGIVLGLGYNALGLNARRPWGMAWKGVDRTAEMPSLEELTAAAAPDPAQAANPYYTNVDDPMALPAAAAASGVPAVPELDRPMEVGVELVRAFVEADAALLLDAREPDEYAAGHIPGSINLPFDEGATDPARLASLETGGRPIIVYCGGGSCEVSMNLAHELIFAGHKRVLVYTGGFPEWETAGLRVMRSEPQGG